MDSSCFWFGGGKREVRTHVTLEDGNREEEIKSVLSSVLDAPNHVYELDVGLIGVSHCTS